MRENSMIQFRWFWLLLVGSNLLFAQILSDGIVVADSVDYPHAVYAGDIDGDGDKDVLYLGWTDGEIGWLENRGDFSFDKHLIVTGFLGARYAELLDIDRDNDMDFIAVARTSDQTAWWENDGEQNFTKHIIDDSRIGPATLSVADMDNDSDDDIVVGCWKTPDVLWYENTGNLNYTKHTLNSGVLSLLSYVEICDINADNLADVVAISCNDGEIVWFENMGSNVFDLHILESNLECGHTVRTADVDQDGDFDLLAAYYSQNLFLWWENDGLGNFQRHLLGSVTGRAIFLECVDFDDDGDNDVVGCTEFSENIYFYENDGEQNFILKIMDNNITGLTCIDLVDIDNDFDPEIIGAGSTGNSIVLWGNCSYSCSFGYSVYSGHAPLTVNFFDSTTSRFPVNQWGWDFDNDGTVDSHDQNPVWRYTEPGDYSIMFNVTIDSVTQNSYQSNVIHVFDGESALLFNGEDGMAVCMATPDLNLDSSFTLEAWIKPKGWGDSGTTGYGRIIDKDKIKFMIIGPGNSNLNDNCLTLQLAHEEETYSFHSSPENSIDLDEWQHVACVYTPGIIRLYINGVEQNLTSSVDDIQVIGNNLDNELIIGNNVSEFYTFDGIIDEVRVWNLGRTSPQIADNYSIYLNGDEVGLLAYWRMNEGSGSKILDYSVYSNDLNLNDVEWAQGALEYISDIGHPNSEIIPEIFSLKNAYPNPFNNQTVISYKIPVCSNIQLSIYNVLGQHIATLVNENQAAGHYRLRWNGKDSAGNTVSAGIYFICLQSNENIETKKVLFLK